MDLTELEQAALDLRGSESPGMRRRWVSSSELELAGIVWWPDGRADPVWARLTFHDPSGPLVGWEIGACVPDGPLRGEEVDRLWRRGRLHPDGIDWMFTASGVGAEGGPGATPVEP